MTWWDHRSLVASYGQMSTKRRPATGKRLRSELLENLYYKLDYVFVDLSSHFPSSWQKIISNPAPVFKKSTFLGQGGLVHGSPLTLALIELEKFQNEFE